MKRRMFLKMSAMIGLMAASVLKLFENKRLYLTKCKHDEMIGLRTEWMPEFKNGLEDTSTNIPEGEWEITKKLEEFHFRGKLVHNYWRNKFILTPVGKTSPEILLFFSTKQGEPDCFDLSREKFYRV